MMFTLTHCAVVKRGMSGPLRSIESVLHIFLVVHYEIRFALDLTFLRRLRCDDKTLAKYCLSFF